MIARTVVAESPVVTSSDFYHVLRDRSWVVVIAPCEEIYLGLSFSQAEACPQEKRRQKLGED